MGRTDTTKRKTVQVRRLHFCHSTVQLCGYFTGTKQRKQSNDVCRIQTRINAYPSRFIFRITLNNVGMIWPATIRNQIARTAHNKSVQYGDFLHNGYLPKGVTTRRLAAC
ncbi:MAG: hypothetical protein XXXJIFNMEKO3_LKCDNKCA_00105 (plasmid) [Candidatus Erwinia impunctatus]